MNKDQYFMEEALKEAEIAYGLGEVPVGCVIVREDEIIARGHNERETSNHVFMHAEMIAMDEACKKLDSWRLDECTIYVTLEPCAMCEGTMIQSRVKKLVYASKEPKSGVHQSITNLFSLPFNHQVVVENGLLDDLSSALLKRFFKELRSQKELK